MIGIVVSMADRASEHIYEHLLEIGDWRVTHDEHRPPEAGGGDVRRIEGFELRTFEELHLELDRVATTFDDPDLIVFASRHSGDTGRLLTVHHPGNVGPAEYGGSDRDLARACPNAHKRVLAAMADHAPEAYDVGMECTHHGPTDVGAPAMFVEVGSGPEQWDDPDGARAVARAILDLAGTPPEKPQEDGDDSARRHVVGFGGNHYAPRFERVVRETDWAVGHVAADWGLEAMGDPTDSEDVLRQVFEHSGAEYALLDGDHPALDDAIEALGYDVVSETWLREVDGVALPLARRIEDRLVTVEAGLRFGTPATHHEGEFTVVTFPDELLTAAQRIDREATREAVESIVLAFETEASGSLVGERAAVADPDDRQGLLEALVDVLRSSYDEVSIDDDRVIAREMAFDPDLAESLGVPEGPKFGQLAGGESVEIDGERIEPGDVHRERAVEYPISMP